MSVAIRNADLARDRPAFLRFVFGSNTYESQFVSDRRLDDKFAAEHLDELFQRVAAKQGKVFVAEDEGSPVGWAVCHVDQHDPFVVQDERTFGYVSELYVDEPMRGRHVGRALLKCCEDYFRSLGLKTVLIGALSGNVRAIYAYRAAGYADYAVNLRKLL
jgi:GNAT superfamily N-acetyltransferase